MQSLLLVLLFGVVAYAQLPRPCESPKQWEARIFTQDMSKNYTAYAKGSYDETQRRFREIEEVALGTDREYYDVLYLFNVGKEYRLNLKTKKCNVTNLTRPFRPFGVPPEGQFEFSATIGAAGVPGEYMVVNNFYGNFTDGARFFGTVTSPDCMPVSNGFFSEDTGFVHRTFFDMNIGIADPMVFIPPRECL
ncbi:mammalian ependymin-related protein 1-like [Mizuhopecten yessoensis]|uniref:Mammalian ependymin-related protein 1 n=1 Tax=Mizuhopecten yessoensis TaxID=6573 RepID=A0A210PKV8_MIZYE|nr:mammalian ependymin-related protein 1-like [Mizuhopecten yessoensis]OWF37119.1 Mammalian ependymin-related protein 1 [Mizuhopecten yessoensis]